jgi:polysaccharide export outer membrane protein
MESTFAAGPENIKDTQTLDRLAKGLWGLCLACTLGVIQSAVPREIAQGQQSQEPTELTAQPADLSQQETKPETPEVPSAPAPLTDYVIGPEDVLSIDVFDVPELSKLVVRVANDGSISVPLLGQVHAGGLTIRQLREELQSGWGKTYLQNPQVTLFVNEFHARPVSVIGAVDKPGLYYLTGPRTLIEVLALAGGLAKVGTAPGRTLVVTRKDGFEDLQPCEGMREVAPDKAEINIPKLLYSRDSALDIPIKPFDTISVSKADIVYVVGDVKRNGGFVLQDQEKITVLQALALAQGLNVTAAKGHTLIIRRSPDGSRTEVPLDLGKILKGKSQDVEMAGNDILFVPTSTGKAAAKRGAETAIATISGMLIYRGP